MWHPNRTSAASEGAERLNESDTYCCRGAVWVTQ